MPRLKISKGKHVKTKSVDKTVLLFMGDFCLLSTVFSLEKPF